MHRTSHKSNIKSTIKNTALVWAVVLLVILADLLYDLAYIHSSLILVVPATIALIGAFVTTHAIRKRLDTFDLHRMRALNTTERQDLTEDPDLR